MRSKYKISIFTDRGIFQTVFARCACIFSSQCYDNNLFEQEVSSQVVRWIQPYLKHTNIGVILINQTYLYFTDIVTSFASSLCLPICNSSEQPTGLAYHCLPDTQTWYR